MTLLEGLIHHWERVLFDYQYILDVTTKVIIENTIASLKRLQKLERGTP